MLQVRENEISLREWSAGGTAQLRTLEEHGRRRPLHENDRISDQIQIFYCNFCVERGSASMKS